MTEGLEGMFVDEITNSFKAGQRVVKMNSEEGDFSKDGEEGTIVKVLNTESLKQLLGEEPMYYMGEEIKFFYLVTWDKSPEHEVGVIGNKVKLKNE